MRPANCIVYPENLHSSIDQRETPYPASALMSSSPAACIQSPKLGIGIF